MKKWVKDSRYMVSITVNPSPLSACFSGIITLTLSWNSAIFDECWIIFIVKMSAENPAEPAIWSGFLSKIWNFNLKVHQTWVAVLTAATSLFWVLLSFNPFFTTWLISTTWSLIPLKKGQFQRYIMNNFLFGLASTYTLWFPSKKRLKIGPKWPSNLWAP